MYSFNTSYVSVQEKDCPKTAQGASWFQYILCVGSRSWACHCSSFSFPFQYILCVGSRVSFDVSKSSLSVSIHLMCRFKNPSELFSYPIKEVSIHLMCRFKLHIYPCFANLLPCFNTSYVSVQVGHMNCHLPGQESFNTSYVSVQVFALPYRRVRS